MANFFVVSLAEQTSNLFLAAQSQVGCIVIHYGPLDFVPFVLLLIYDTGAYRDWVVPRSLTSDASTCYSDGKGCMAKL
jgi:hypothetical protein